jgi:SCP1.201-like deaminase
VALARRRITWSREHVANWNNPRWRRRVVSIPSEQRPAPFDPEVAKRVPVYGTRGSKTTGAVFLGSMVVMFDSGEDGPALRLPKPRRGMHGNVVTHVEAHTAAVMRLEGVHEAVLYINRLPCVPKRGKGCEYLLPFMLAPGDKLTVYGPDGYMRVFTGRPVREASTQ